MLAYMKSFKPCNNFGMWWWRWPPTTISENIAFYITTQSLSWSSFTNQESVCDGAFAGAENGGDNAMVWKILEETLDLFESPVWCDAEQNSLEYTVDVLQEECWVKYLWTTLWILHQPAATWWLPSPWPMSFHSSNMWPIALQSYHQHGGYQDNAPSSSSVSYRMLAERLPTVLETKSSVTHNTECCTA